MKKILIVSTVSRQFYLFEQGNIEVLNSLGYEVHAAANYSDVNNERLDSLDIIRHHFDIDRSPFTFRNVNAYRQLKRLLENEKFDAIHCHSPMGGVLARLAAKATGTSPTIYTAHGFHFYKGAPIINWLIYYPVERFLSKYTDLLITINEEDFNKAQIFKAKDVIHVPGIGINTKKFRDVTKNRDKKRAELEITSDTVVLISVGEMIKRKNHETALRALAKVKNKNFIYLICGRGQLEDYLMNLTKTLGLDDKVRFLGFRNDIPEMCAASDVFLFPSYQEGLPVSVIEAMSVGLPIICSRIRGNTDLIKDGIGGFLIEPKDINGFANKIEQLINNDKDRIMMGKSNYDSVQRYDIDVIKNIMEKVYKSL